MQERGSEAAAGTDEARQGLCASCRHALRVRGLRDSEFIRCGRSAGDARFPKYPVLPVRTCPGHEHH